MEGTPLASSTQPPRRVRAGVPARPARAPSPPLLPSLTLPAAAQTIEQEGDRIPGIPETSIAVNLPPEFRDPGGVRAMLAGRGVTYAVNYIGDMLGNPVGGFAQGTRYIGRLDLELGVDLEKAIGWKGLTFFTNGYQIHGQSISALNLGALMPVSFIEALPSTRLFELWLEQKLLDDHLYVALRAALGRHRVHHQQGSGRVSQRDSGAGRQSPASICRMEARPIRWRRRLHASPSIPMTTSASSSAYSAATRLAIARKICRRCAIRTGSPSTSTIAAADDRSRRQLQPGRGAARRNAEGRDVAAVRRLRADKYRQRRPADRTGRRSWRTCRARSRASTRSSTR